jgi:hypothetical protein
MQARHTTKLALQMRPDVLTLPSRFIKQREISEGKSFGRFMKTTDSHRAADILGELSTAQQAAGDPAKALESIMTAIQYYTDENIPATAVSVVIM